MPSLAPEKRNHRRRIYRGLFYLQKDNIEIFRSGTFELQARGVDISQGGIGFTIQNEINEKETVNLLFFPTPLFASLPYLRAEVVWSRPHKNGFRCGLRFMS